jgi:hypothetical protein
MKNNKDILFKSKVSNWIAGLYWSILIFLVIMFIGVPFLSPMTFVEKNIFVINFLIIFLIIGFTLFKAYRLHFIISKKSLIISGLLKNHTILFSDINEVTKVPIPFGFRLFGASFLGGKYYFPGIGNAWVAMSNFDDGVMITTKLKKNYVITPKNPTKFIKLIKEEIS